MATKVLGGFVVLLVVGIPAYAVNPQISVLKKQVSALKHEHTSVAKAIRARFKALTKQVGMDAKAQSQLQSELVQEEKQLLALTKVKSEKDQIRQKYSTMRNNLKQGGKLDKAQVKELKQAEKVLLAQVDTLYNAQIQTLETQIAVLVQQDNALRQNKKR